MASGPRETVPKTFRSSSAKAWNDEQAGVPLSHSAVPHRRARPVRWLIANATLAPSVANVCGCRANKMEQFVKNGLHPSGSPAYRSGAPTRGSGAELGDGVELGAG